jgi:hypothetical protein
LEQGLTPRLMKLDELFAASMMTQSGTALLMRFLL